MSSLGSIDDRFNKEITNKKLCTTTPSSKVFMTHIMISFREQPRNILEIMIFLYNIWTANRHLITPAKGDSEPCGVINGGHIGFRLQYIGT